MGQTAPFFPVALLLEGRLCLVVGSSEEAERRARSLREAGARVRLVAPDPCEALRALLAEDGELEHVAGVAYATSHLDDVWLAVLADRDTELAERIGKDCQERRIFHCAVDQPEQNSFAHVGLAKAGALQIAISTDGKAPALARRLKRELERVFDESNLADFVNEISEARSAAAPDERASVTTRLASRLHLRGTLVVDDE